MERKNIVITGATGLLGSYLLPLLREEYNVWAICLDKPDTDEADPIFWVQYDLSGDLGGLRELLPERINALIHLAQSPHFREFPDHAQHVFNVNINTTMHLLDIAQSSGCSHFINASSGGVYEPSSSPLMESDAKLLPMGSGFYPVSKQCGELLVNSYAKLMHTINLRFFFIYGKGQEKGMLIPRLVESVFSGNEILLQGKDGLRINPIYASDAAMAVKRCLQLNEPYTMNVAGQEAVSLRQIGEIIGCRLGKSPVFEENQSDSSEDLVADISKMKRLLGSPKVNIEAGIAEYCNGLI